MLTSKMANLLSTKSENILFSDDEKLKNVSNFI